MPYIDIQFGKLIVGERPQCYWDLDINTQVTTFLNNMDPNYFESMANVFYPHILDPGEEETLPIKHKLMSKLIRHFRKSGYLPEVDPQHAALALRLIYSQALETMFALICGSVQAPRCIHAWMLKYWPSEVRELLEKINDGKSFPWQLTVKTPSWYAISNFIFYSLVLEDKEKEERIKKGFANFWSRLASDFVNQSFTDEYNSMKHGLRVLSGGFAMAIGRQEKQGMPTPNKQMHLLGKSEFGSSFLTSVQIGKHKHHFQSKRSSRNWSPIDISWALHLVSMSLRNIVESLKIMNGTPADEVRFVWPEDLDVFKEPWERSKKLGITSMTGFGPILDPSIIKPYTLKEIKDDYLKGKYMGVLRCNFQDEADQDQSS